MKTDDLYKRLDVFKEKIKQRLVELTKEDLIFPKENKSEMFGKLQMNQERREEDFYI
jgi:hypothetical protein